MRMICAALVLSATPAVADDCVNALGADKPDRALDEACLSHDPLAVLTLGVGLGGSSLGGVFSYYGTLDIPIGPLRFEGRGRLTTGSSVEGLVGYRISYSYRAGDVEWTTSTTIGHTSRTEYSSSAGGFVTTDYDVKLIQGHSAASLIRSETVLVAGVRGMDVPMGSFDFGKTFEAGIQWFSTSGFHTHRRVELLGVLRDGKPGGVLVWDNAVPPSGRLIGGLEMGYVPYTGDKDNIYVVFDLGVGYDL